MSVAAPYPLQATTRGRPLPLNVCPPHSAAVRGPGLRGLRVRGGECGPRWHRHTRDPPTAASLWSLSLPPPEHTARRGLSPGPALMPRPWTPAPRAVTNKVCGFGPQPGLLRCGCRSPCVFLLMEGRTGDQLCQVDRKRPAGGRGWRRPRIDTAVWGRMPTSLVAQGRG